MGAAYLFSSNLVADTMDQAVCCDDPIMPSRRVWCVMKLDMRAVPKAKGFFPRSSIWCKGSRD